MRLARQEIWTSAEVSRLLSLLSSERDYLARVLDALPTPVAVLAENLTVALANEAFWSASGATARAGLGEHIEELTGDATAGAAIRKAASSEDRTVILGARGGRSLPSFVVAELPGNGELVLAGKGAAELSTDNLNEPFRTAFLAHPEPQALADSSGTLTAVNDAAAALGLAAGSKWTSAGDDGERSLRLPGPQAASYSITTRELGSGATLIMLHNMADRARVEEHQRFTDRMDAVSSLAGGVSHQLNNILTVISSYCHMALDQVAQGGDPAADIDAILKASGDATQLGNQLIAIGRRHVVEEGPTDLNEVLLGLERTIRGICGDAVQVSVATEPRLPAVPVDARQLERAILAIVLHAREAMTESGTISLRSALAEGRVVLEIADTRNWPDGAVSMRLFEPYAGWPQSKKHSGLELAVAWCILQQRGADVSIARSGGKTAVRIAFGAHKSATPQPQPQPEPPEARSSVEPAAGPKSQGTVLLVDDNNEIRRAIRHMLEREAYHVIDVGHPLQALRAIEQLSNPIDVLVSDVNMPDMNGRELAQRARELRPGLRVLMISGYADEEIIIGQLFDEGVMFLQKPFSPDRLLKSMRNLVEQRSSRA
jgi:CheY-like chemotaxis protein